MKSLFNAKKIAKIAGSVILMTLVSLTQAATIAVNSYTDDPLDADCTLRKAIQSVMDEAFVSGCANNSSNQLGVDDQIVFINAPSVGLIGIESQLPVITKPVAINGATGGANDKVILYLNANVNNQFRAFRVEYTGILDLSNLVIGGGYLLEPEVGGAISTDGKVILTNSKVSENRAWEGGAVFVECGAELVLDNSTLSSNESTGSGGAVYGENCSKILATESSFYQNTAGIEADGGLPYEDGGAIFHQGLGDWNLVINNSTFYENHASGSGGALAAWGTTLIHGTTISNNTSFISGAGLYVRPLASGMAVKIDVVNTSLIDNQSELYPDSTVYIYTQSSNVGSGAMFKNTVIAKSGTEGISDKGSLLRLSNFGTLELTDGGGNWIQDDSFESIGIDQGEGFGLENYPGLGPLSNHGGAGMTHMPLEDANGLGMPSAVVDAGECVEAADLMTWPEADLAFVDLNTDQNGGSRLIGGQCDSGSVELFIDEIFGHGFETLE